MVLHHGHDFGSSSDKTLRLLGYMYDHNAEHIAELDDIIASLHEEGRQEAADEVLAAREKFEEGNELLHDAIHDME